MIHPALRNHLTSLRAGATIAIDPEVLSRLREEAAARGLSAESLANLWLQERILKQHA